MLYFKKEAKRIRKVEKEQIGNAAQTTANDKGGKCATGGAVLQLYYNMACQIKNGG